VSEIKRARSGDVLLLLCKATGCDACAGGSAGIRAASQHRVRPIRQQAASAPRHRGAQLRSAATNHRPPGESCCDGVAHDGIGSARARVPALPRADRAATRIVSRLGKGAMGIVYAACDDQIGP